MAAMNCTQYTITSDFLNPFRTNETDLFFISKVYSIQNLAW